MTFRSKAAGLERDQFGTSTSAGLSLDPSPVEEIMQACFGAEVGKTVSQLIVSCNDVTSRTTCKGMVAIWIKGT